MTPAGHKENEGYIKILTMRLHLIAADFIHGGDLNGVLASSAFLVRAFGPSDMSIVLIQTILAESKLIAASTILVRGFDGGQLAWLGFSEHRQVITAVQLLVLGRRIPRAAQPDGATDGGFDAGSVDGDDGNELS